MAPVTRKSAALFAEPVHYKLHGVLYHHGKWALVAALHYTVYVLHQNGDCCGGETWLYIEVVCVVQHNDVFSGHDS
jgi:hypothetical protein